MSVISQGMEALDDIMLSMFSPWKEYFFKEGAIAMWIVMEIFFSLSIHSIRMHLYIPIFSLSWSTKAFESWKETLGGLEWLRLKKLNESDLQNIRIVKTSADPGFNRRVRICQNLLIKRTFGIYEQWMTPIIEEKKIDDEEFMAKFDRGQRARQSYLYIGVYQQLPPDNAWKTVRKGFNAPWISITTIQIGVGLADYLTSGSSQILLWFVTGVILSIISGSVEYWHRENRYIARLSEADQDKEVALALHDNPRHAAIVMGIKGGWDLERMAKGDIEATSLYKIWSKPIATIILLCWIILVVSAYFLEASPLQRILGNLGMIHSFYSHGVAHKNFGWPGSMGIPLEFKAVIGGVDWMEALVELEMKYPGAGRSLLDAYLEKWRLGYLEGIEREIWERLEECERDDVEIRAPKVREIEEWLGRTGIFLKMWKGSLNLAIHLP